MQRWLIIFSFILPFFNLYTNPDSLYTKGLFIGIQPILSNNIIKETIPVAFANNYFVGAYPDAIIVECANVPDIDDIGLAYTDKQDSRQ